MEVDKAQLNEIMRGIGEKNDRISELENMLEDVVNELDLSDLAMEQHGPMGTPPAELVKLVLDEKDLKIVALKAGLIVMEQDDE